MKLNERQYPDVTKGLRLGICTDFFDLHSQIEFKQLSIHRIDFLNVNNS